MSNAQVVVRLQYICFFLTVFRKEILFVKSTKCSDKITRYHYLLQYVCMYLTESVCLGSKCVIYIHVQEKYQAIF